MGLEIVERDQGPLTPPQPTRAASTGTMAEPVDDGADPTPAPDTTVTAGPEARDPGTAGPGTDAETGGDASAQPAPTAALTSEPTPAPTTTPPP